MAKISLGRHIRSIRRAGRRLRKRQIKPVLAIRLIGRSSWRIAHAVVVVVLLLGGAVTVLLIMASGSVVRKFRGYGSLARSKKTNITS